MNAILLNIKVDKKQDILDTFTKVKKEKNKLFDELIEKLLKVEEFKSGSDENGFDRVKTLFFNKILNKSENISSIKLKSELNKFLNKTKVKIRDIPLNKQSNLDIKDTQLSDNKIIDKNIDNENIVDDLVFLSLLLKNKIDIRDFQTSSKKLKSLSINNKDFRQQLKEAKSLKDVIKVAKNFGIEIKNFRIEVEKSKKVKVPNAKEITSTDFIVRLTNKKYITSNNIKKDQSSEHRATIKQNSKNITLKSLLSTIDESKIDIKSKIKNTKSLKRDIKDNIKNHEELIKIKQETKQKTSKLDLDRDRQIDKVRKSTTLENKDMKKSIENNSLNDKKEDKNSIKNPNIDPKEVIKIKKDRIENKDNLSIYESKDESGKSDKNIDYINKRVEKKIKNKVKIDQIDIYKKTDKKDSKKITIVDDKYKIDKNQDNQKYKEKKYINLKSRDIDISNKNKIFEKNIIKSDNPNISRDIKEDKNIVIENHKNIKIKKSNNDKFDSNIKIKDQRNIKNINIKENKISKSLSKTNLRSKEATYPSHQSREFKEINKTSKEIEKLDFQNIKIESKNISIKSYLKNKNIENKKNGYKEQKQKDIFNNKIHNTSSIKNSFLENIILNDSGNIKQNIINENNIKNNIQKSEDKIVENKTIESENSKKIVSDVDTKIEVIDTKVTTKISHHENKNIIKTLNTFAQEFKEQVENYKPPLMKIKMQLKPVGLGDVDVTMINRGKNLHITLNSNPHTIAIFAQNQIEFKNTLINMGFSELNMSFNENSKNRDEQNQKQKKSSEKFENFSEEESFEIVTPIYI